MNSNLGTSALSSVESSTKAAAKAAANIDRLLLKYLLQNIREAVLFIGKNQQILAWNRAAENLIGIGRNVQRDLDWLFGYINLVPRQSQIVATSECSVRDAIFDQKELMLFATLIIADKPPAPVDLQVIPMYAEAGSYLGSMLILHDATYKVNLQQQVQELMEKTTSDPLTGVCNRAEFERVLAACCQSFKSKKTAFSLIICDIDFFKRINDDYGHDIGDQALIMFAQTLRRELRQGDFLARYGGEEFVILCQGCDARAAIDCAEKIRRQLELTAQPVLQQKCLTASFGVAHFNREDTAKSVFVRADQSLLRAKESGRNCVVFGEYHSSAVTRYIGAAEEVAAELNVTADVIVSREIASSSPIAVLAAKLDGFVQEQQAQILAIEPQRIILQTPDEASFFRRSSDRRIAFQVEIRFDNLSAGSVAHRGFVPHTGLKIKISVVRQRDRRSNSVRQQAEFLLRMLYGYLMLNPETLERAAKSSGRR